MLCVLFQNYTQYIPLSIYDLQTWMGSPSIFVYDCSNAGLVVKSFRQFALQREQELEVRLSSAQAVSWASAGAVAGGRGAGLRAAHTSPVGFAPSARAR